MSSQFHKELAIMFDDPFERAEEAVSYTHLDVYKRQHISSLQFVTVEIFRRFLNIMRLLLSVTEQIINMVLSSAHMISSMRGER